MEECRIIGGILLECENNDIVITNKTKMDELLKLLEELVINKIRIEKIKQSIKENDYKKVLDQEIQIVDKVQKILKKIQTSEMKDVFRKLLDDIKQNAKNTIKYHFYGDDAEFDNSLEASISILLKDILEIYERSNSNYISISAFNNSSSLVIQITNDRNKTTETEQKNIYNKERISLINISEAGLTKWLENVSLLDLMNVFQNIKNTSRMTNAVIELESEKSIFKSTIITIPYSSSITNAQFIKLSNQTFAIPVEYIGKIINANTVKIKKSSGIDFINYMDRIIPIILIDKKLDITIDEDYGSFVILEYNGQMQALPVNSILEQSDIVVRQKPQAISEISEFKGMAILDDGNVTIVIDVPSLFQCNT